MSPWRRILSLLLLISLVTSSHAINCDACEDENCKKGGCIGDYCISSLYKPRFGWTSLSEEGIVVKGCLNGSMMADNIKPRCYSNENDESEMCICDTDKCTSKKKAERERTQKVQCHCTDKKNCKKGKCTGDLCYWTQHLNELAIKGCMDLSVPLLERRAIDSCMLPPMSGSMHSLALGHKSFANLLDTESCICSTQFCNKEKPLSTDKEELKEMDSQKCSTIVRGRMKGRNYTTEEGSCRGEFCYRMTISGKDVGELESYVAEGCATFNPKRKMDVEFGTGQCATFKGNDLSVKTCYKTSDEEAKKRLEKSVREEESEEENEEDDEEEIEIVHQKSSKGKDERSNRKKDEKKEEEEEEKDERRDEKEGDGRENEEKEKKEEDQKNIGGKEEIPTHAKHFVFVAPTEAPTPDESNATMITVFVLIILCICVAGITWKFQLHRKLMRANYDTVAGG